MTNTPVLGTFVGWLLRVTVYHGCTTTYNGDDYSIYECPRSLIPKWAIGQTWGRSIIVLGTLFGESMQLYGKTVKHEKIHVEQWKRLGWFGLGFMMTYLWQWIRFGYDKIPLELEAMAGE